MKTVTLFQLIDPTMLDDGILVEAIFPGDYVASKEDPFTPHCHAVLRELGWSHDMIVEAVENGKWRVVGFTMNSQAPPYQQVYIPSR